MTQAGTALPGWLQPARDVFVQRLETDRLAHALLLHGPSGTGKTLLARKIVATLLCLRPDGGAACGACRSCELFASGAHPDWFRLYPPEGKHQIQIGAVRDMIHSLGFTTTISPRKVALIEPAEAMNRNAANALLKILEEPPGDAVLLLVSHDPARLPVTIRSRCQAIVAAMPRWKESVQWLTAAGGIGAQEAADSLKAAGGSPLRAKTLHDQGLVAAHGELLRALTELRQGSARVATVADGFKEIDAALLWSWLSVATAELLRGSGAGDSGRRAWAQLQLEADRNRRLAGTAVREDLLLRDWLIKWSRTARP